MKKISKLFLNSDRFYYLFIALLAGILLNGCTGFFQQPADIIIESDATEQALELETIVEPLTIRSLPAGALTLAQKHFRVNVFYATDRKRSGYIHPTRFYGSDRGKLDYGVAVVSIPHDHRVGVLESPDLLRFEFRENPDKHVVLMSVQAFAQKDFLQKFKTTLQNAPQPEALIFLHGYNVSFEDAVRRTAQVSYDLEFPGIPVLYSWPSQGTALKYPFDENNARWTLSHFEEFLELMLTQTGASTVHVIAHSMGSRVLAEALRSCNIERLPADSARLRQVVFAAPDIDADTFRQLAQDFHDDAERITLYVSAEDKALGLSQTIHRYPRAGDFGDELVVINGVDTIDASSLATDFLGHSYYGDNESIIADIHQIMKNGHSPEQRNLLPGEHNNGRYWVFKP